MSMWSSGPQQKLNSNTLLMFVKLGGSVTPANVYRDLQQDFEGVTLCPFLLLHTVNPQKIEDGSGMISAGCPCSLGFGVGGQFHIPTFWLLL